MSHRTAHHAMLRWASVEDTPALQDLFCRAFGADATEAEWRWKYASGDGFSLVAAHGDRAMAHYGGQTRALLGLGTACRAIQVSDIMVDPAARGALGRNGLFARITEAFATELTLPQGEHAFIFGFPSPRAARLGQVLGLYSPLDELEQLAWHASAPGATRAPAAVSPARLLPHADRLWRRQARVLGHDHLITVRDAAWVQRRFLSRPAVNYEALEATSRWRRRPLAALIFREHGEALELIDLLGDPAAFPELVAGLRAQASLRHKPQAFGWLTPAAQSGLPSANARTPLLQVMMAGPERASLAPLYASRCWMTAGDTDYR